MNREIRIFVGAPVGNYAEDFESKNCADCGCFVYFGGSHLLSIIRESIESDLFVCLACARKRMQTLKEKKLKITRDVVERTGLPEWVLQKLGRDILEPDDFGGVGS